MKKTYHIDGMHCKACEMLVKKSLEKKLPQCQIHTVNHRKGTLCLSRIGKEQHPKLKKIIASCGYCLSDTPGQNNSKEGDTTSHHRSKPQFSEVLAIILCAAAITRVLIEVDVFAFIGNMQVDASLGAIVLLGLVASVSTCLAVTGGVIMGFTEMIKDGDGWKTHAKLHGSFHLGRILGFFLFGAALGGLGQVVSIGLGFAPYMNAFIAMIFVYLGLQILGITPSLSSLGVHMPTRWSDKIFNYHNPYLAPVVGALTFFLPCGFTQSVQLMALASGSRLSGGLMMAVFAGGTIPGLLALGMGTSFAKDHRKAGFEKIIAGVLLIFGFFTLWGSANVWGWTDGQFGGIDDATIANDQSVIELSLGHNGYQLVPERSTIQAGKNYRITITPSQNGLGCMTTVKAPRISNQIYNVIAGQPMQFDITNANGTYSFVCGAMGMRQGEIIAQ